MDGVGDNSYTITTTRALCGANDRFGFTLYFLYYYFDYSPLKTGTRPD